MSEKRRGGGGNRRSRVAHAMRDALTEMIAADVKDPRVQAAAVLTITRVELNVDLSVARCYVSIVGSAAETDAALAGLAKAASFLRGPLGRRLALQRAPELRFILDPSLDVAAQLSAIVREDEARARAAGREAGSAEPAPAGLAAGAPDGAPAEAPAGDAPEAPPEAAGDER